jgi:uncharacterized protein (DUF924 family)
MDKIREENSESEPWVQDVLGYWFVELDRKAWFTKQPDTDDAIRSRFGALYHRLVALDTASLTCNARTTLAAILVFDQFPRNMFRDTPMAFASDDNALALANIAVATCQDRVLEPVERVFVYLPFEHSEALADQDRAVSLISALGDAEFTRYAEAHRDVIRAFGRFPHRNRILGRVSTVEEKDYLAKPGSGF